MIGDYNPQAGWIVTIDEEEIRNSLQNLQGKGDQHPYRFVFLYTCESASGMLCDAFGIIRIPCSRTQFSYNNLKARTFVGFNGKYTIPGTGNIIYKEAMLTQFFAEWRDGASINGIVGRAKQNTYWPLDATSVIYGATNLYRYYPY